MERYQNTSVSQRSTRRSCGAAVPLGLLLAAGISLVTPTASVADAAATAGKTTAPETPLLPPAAAWDGPSRALVVDLSDPWITPAEASGLLETPTYDATVAYLERLDAASDQLVLVSLARTAEGRDVIMAVVSREGAATPAALGANGRPTLLAQAGIHAGEIDGKDAGLMLLRDMVVNGRQSALLDGANLLFVPMLNPDGHERRSAFARVNQRGPRLTGWRTNARNLNLNRDYTKLDTPEIRGLVEALDSWQPDLFLDLHVTDGADYQYDITYGWHGYHDRAAATWSPGTVSWLNRRFEPEVAAALRAAGHIPGPLVFHVDNDDQTKGLWEWPGGPRFSTTYGEARQLASVLVENHSLKPYDQRVLGTYVLLQQSMRTLARHGGELAALTGTDRGSRPDPVVLDWQESPAGPPSYSYLGIEQRFEPSAISGGRREVWTGKPVTLMMPLTLADRPKTKVARPVAWWLPPSWPEVIERLRGHGVQMETVASARSFDGEVQILAGAKLAGSGMWPNSDNPFEGHALVEVTPRFERRRVDLPRGSVRVPADQPLGTLAALLLEPASPDSFFAWGFFLEVLQRTEYIEGYAIEPMAEAMLEEDPELRAEFDRRLTTDPAFAADPKARLRFFYERTPFVDDRYLVYPVVREIAN